jgi:predicted lysophospholipase L1 biosynthesis ABC-type transport system permease subunit
VAAVAPRLPGSGTTAALLLDLHVLEARAVAIGGSVPAANQVWVSTTRPDATAAAVRAVLTERTRVVSPRTLSPRPLLDPTLVLVEFGVGVTVLLAVLGFAAVAASIGQRRRVELAPLRSLGLTVARIRGARVIELVTTAAIAVVLGALAGLLTAVLVVPGLAGVLA